MWNLRYSWNLWYLRNTWTLKCGRTREIEHSSFIAVNAITSKATICSITTATSEKSAKGQTAINWQWPLLKRLLMLKAGWQKLRGSTGGRKVWTRTKILSPNIRYFVTNWDLSRFTHFFWRSLGIKSAFLGKNSASWASSNNIISHSC